MSNSLSYRFGRHLRLNDKTAIQTVFQSGKKLGSRELSLFFCANILNHPRICISISKKQVPKAHTRNLIKRIMRESFRLNQHKLPACDMVIVIYKSLSLLDRKMVHEKIGLAWDRLNKFLSN